MRGGIKLCIACFCIMLIFIISGCTIEGSNPDSAKNGLAEPIKIGFIGSLTGNVAVAGESMRRGVEIAEKEINQNGGINGRPVRVIYEDDSCDSKKTISAFNKLVAIDKVKVIIGPLCSGTVLSVAPLAESNGIVLFTPVATAADISKAGDYIFRDSISDTYQGKFLAEYLYDNLGFRNMGVIYVNNDYGVQLFGSFKENFDKRGGKIRIAEIYGTGETDFRTNLIKIKDKNVDGLLIICNGKECGLIPKQARELGIDVRFVATDNFYSPDSVQIGGSTVEGTVLTAPALDKASSAVQYLMQKSIMAYGDEPSKPHLTANAYDALMIIADAIQSGGYSSSAVKEYIYRVKDYTGVGGVLTFDENGDVEKPLEIFVVKNGKFEKYGSP